MGMNICIFQRLYYPEAGGMYTYMNRIKRELEERGHKVTLLTAENRTTEKDVHQVTSFRFPPHRNAIQLISFVFFLTFRVLLLHKKEKIDILYPAGPTGASTWLLKHLTGARVINHLPYPQRGDFDRIRHKDIKERFRYVHYIVLEWLSMKGADRVITLSENLKSIIVEKTGFPEDRITVIPNGIDVKPTTKDLGFRKKLGVKGDETMFLFAGGVQERKGIRELLLAWYCLPKNKNKLFCLGSIEPKFDSDVNIAEGYVHTTTWGRVLFPGFVPDDDLERFFNAADVFVFPSRWEGQPFILLEAMAHGLPIITTNICGMADMIENGRNGFLVEPYNHKELEEALKKTTTADLQSMGRESLKMAKEYSWSMVADKTEKAFMEVLNEDN